MQDILTNPLMPLFLMLPVFYFLLIRPQQRRAKMLRDAISNVRRGDTVITAGGLIGKVVKAPGAEDAEVVLEIADNVQVRVLKVTLSEVRAKSQPADASKSS